MKWSAVRIFIEQCSSCRLVSSEIVFLTNPRSFVTLEPPVMWWFLFCFRMLKVFNWRPREKAVTIWRRSSHWRDNLRLSSWCNHHMSMSWMERDANYRVMTRHRCNHRMSMSKHSLTSLQPPSDQRGKGDTLSICIQNTIINAQGNKNDDAQSICNVLRQCVSSCFASCNHCFFPPCVLFKAPCVTVAPQRHCSTPPPGDPVYWPWIDPALTQATCSWALELLETWLNWKQCSNLQNSQYPKCPFSSCI